MGSSAKKQRASPEAREQLLKRVPAKVLREFAQGCSSCRGRAYCTVSCWHKRGFWEAPATWAHLRRLCGYHGAGLRRTPPGCALARAHGSLHAASPAQHGQTRAPAGCALPRRSPAAGPMRAPSGGALARARGRPGIGLGTRRRNGCRPCPLALRFFLVSLAGHLFLPAWPRESSFPACTAQRPFWLPDRCCRSQPVEYRAQGRREHNWTRCVFMQAKPGQICPAPRDVTSQGFSRAAYWSSVGLRKVGRILSAPGPSLFVVPGGLLRSCLVFFSLGGPTRQGSA